MAKITMEAYEEFPVLPADTIIGVKVDEITIAEKQGNRGPWQKAEFKFKILSVPSPEFGKLVGEAIWGSTPFRFTESPDNKLRQWVEAIFGMELSEGFELDTDLLIGRECRAIIGNYDKKAINPRTNQPYKAHQVESLLSKGGQGVAAAQQPVMATTAPAPVQDSWTQSSTSGWNDEPPF